MSSASPAVGKREQTKQANRRAILDAGAAVFADLGYGAASVRAIVRRPDLATGTFYNYFPDKQDLVFDRLDEFRERLSRAVADRPAGTSPAQAVRALAHLDIERHRGAVPEEARGELPALSVSSAAIRRGTLEMFDQQADAAAAAIVETSPTIHPAVARAHAAALVSVFQLIVDRTGRGVLDGTPPDVVVDELTPRVEAVLDDLDHHFRSAHGNPR